MLHLVTRDVQNHLRLNQHLRVHQRARLRHIRHTQWVAHALIRLRTLHQAGVLRHQSLDIAHQILHALGVLRACLHTATQHLIGRDHRCINGLLVSQVRFRGLQARLNERCRGQRVRLTHARVQRVRRIAHRLGGIQQRLQFRLTARGRLGCRRRAGEHQQGQHHQHEQKLAHGRRDEPPGFAHPTAGATHVLSQPGAQTTQALLWWGFLQQVQPRILMLNELFRTGL